MDRTDPLRTPARYLLMKSRLRFLFSHVVVVVLVSVALMILLRHECPVLENRPIKKTVSEFASNVSIDTRPRIAVDLFRPRVQTDATIQIFVVSAQTHRLRRNVIRSTFGTSKSHIIFAVGAFICEIPQRCRHEFMCLRIATECDDDLSRIRTLSNNLEREHHRHKDLLAVACRDEYRDLHEKIALTFRWLLENTRSRWFVKVDDDVYLNPKLIVHSIAHHAATVSNTTPMIIGGIARNWGVHRSGKNLELRYPPSTYPTFAIGCRGYVMNRIVLQYFYDNTSLFYYMNEDTGFGIWISEASFSHPVRFVHEHRMRCDGMCTKNSITTGHNMNEIAMRTCHEKHTR
eukprot:gene1660-2304_t